MMTTNNSPAVRAPYAWGDHFVTRIPIRVVLPLVAMWDEGLTKLNAALR